MCGEIGGCGTGSDQGRWLAADLAASNATLHARDLAPAAVQLGEHGNDAAWSRSGRPCTRPAPTSSSTATTTTTSGSRRRTPTATRIAHAASASSSSAPAAPSCAAFDDARRQQRAPAGRGPRRAQAGRCTRARTTGRSSRPPATSPTPGRAAATEAPRRQSRAASRRARSNAGVARVREQPVEVLAGVRHEVDVERADPLLEHAPHRLAEVGHDPHQRRAARAVGARTSPS